LGKLTNNGIGLFFNEHDILFYMQFRFLYSLYLAELT